jgi:hypothetical protein
MGQVRAKRRQPIEVRRVDIDMAGGAERFEGLIIGEQEEDVGASRLGCGGNRRDGKQKASQGREDSCAAEHRHVVG